MKKRNKMFIIPSCILVERKKEREKKFFFVPFLLLVEERKMYLGDLRLLFENLLDCEQST